MVLIKTVWCLQLLIENMLYIERAVKLSTLNTRDSVLQQYRIALTDGYIFTTILLFVFAFFDINICLFSHYVMPAHWSADAAILPPKPRAEINEISISDYKVYITCLIYHRLLTCFASGGQKHPLFFHKSNIFNFPHAYVVKRGIRASTATVLA